MRRRHISSSRRRSSDVQCLVRVYVQKEAVWVKRIVGITSYLST